MKLKIDTFTIFLILLIVLVAIMFIGNSCIFNKTKESLVNFNKDTSTTTNPLVYIPQYSTDTNNKVTLLYDSLYFDQKNGTIIEVDSKNSPPTNDTTGSSISNIIVAPRDGTYITTYPSKPLNADKTIVPDDTKESLNKNLVSSYTQFSYRTQSNKTDKYQLFYFSWDTETFIYLVKNSILSSDNNSYTNADKGTTIKSFHFTPSGLVNISLVNSDRLPPYGTVSQSIENPSNNSIIKLSGSLSSGNRMLSQDVYQITPYVFYHILSGSIIIKKTTDETIKMYDRKGDEKTNPSTDNFSELSGSPTGFSIPDNNGGMVLVISYKSNTIVSVIQSRPGEKSYILVATKRFYKNKVVNSKIDTIDPIPVATSSIPTMSSCYSKNNFKNNYGSKVTGSVCGDDLSCKWYWYFKTMSDMNNNNSNVFSDDYFLKTEAVPPVCPQCPNCPFTGACTTCGGNGGSGTQVLNNSNTVTNQQPKDNTVTLKLMPVKSSSITYTDASGNLYVSYTDALGNTKYVLQSNVVKSESGKSESGKDNTKKDGSDSISGNIAKTGTSLIDNTAGVANNLINTTGNLVEDAGLGAGILAYSAGSGAVNLLKDAGSGIANLGKGPLQQNNAGRSGMGGTSGMGGMGATSGIGGSSSYGQVSDRKFGKMSGETPVDNYSYYGALQSKGGNYMPITADFSSFRK